MLRKIVRDILIIAGILVLAASTSRTFMQWASDKRLDRDEAWAVRKPKEGDLVAIAYLRYIPKFHSPGDYKFKKHPVENGHIDLYIWGDSHIWKVPDTAYAAVDKFTYVWRGTRDLIYTLDSNRKNILLIEMTERDLRSQLAETDMFNHVRKEQPAAIVPAELTSQYAGITLPFIEDLFNPNINQNIEFNLFNYNFINPIRQCKGAMNYYLFARASGDVVIAKDGEQLFLKQTIRGKQTENSFYPVGDDELNKIVNNLNAINEHYRLEGFNEVYFSVIPNPVTILQPEGTNNLIPRLEHHPALKIKIISIYDLFKQEKTKRIYHRGDTHWNNAGLQIWLAEVNKMLLTEDSLTVQNP